MSDKEKLIELIGEGVYWCTSEDIADHLITNGVVVREKGEWEIRVDDFDNEYMWCPICYEEFYDGDNDTVDRTPNFCHNCGADMRKGENDG